jgi:GNAT superfamily N-acetyltransferase
MTEANKLFLIRDARDDERDALRDLTLDAYEQYAQIMAPSAWRGLRQAISNALATTVPAERIVAELDGTLIGSVMLFPAAVSAYKGITTTEATAPELRLLAVAATARGLGIGRALVETCSQRARNAGATVLSLHTSDSMRTAKALYERMGFERYPAEDFHPDGTELIMAYRLRL